MKTLALKYLDDSSTYNNLQKMKTKKITKTKDKKHKRQKTKKRLTHPRLRKSGLYAPRTRYQETLCLLLESKKPITYIEMCAQLLDVNCHKAIQFWIEKAGRNIFNKKAISHQNRFRRRMLYFRFEVMKSQRGFARRMYNKAVLKVD